MSYRADKLGVDAPTDTRTDRCKQWQYLKDKTGLYRKKIKIFLTQFTNIGNSTSDIGKSTDLPILEYQNELPIAVIWISDIY